MSIASLYSNLTISKYQNMHFTTLVFAHGPNWMACLGEEVIEWWGQQSAGARWQWTFLCKLQRSRKVKVLPVLSWIFAVCTRMSTEVVPFSLQWMKRPANTYCTTCYLEVESRTWNRSKIDDDNTTIITFMQNLRLFSISDSAAAIYP